MRPTALLVVALCAVAAFAAPKKDASWSVISNNLMDIAIGVSVVEGSIYVSGGANGIGPQILRSTDNGASWESLPHGPAMFYLDVDVTDDLAGVAGGLGMFKVMTGLEYTQNGETFVPTTDTFLASAFQNVEAPRNNSLYAVGFWQSTVASPAGNGVVLSRNGGANVEYFDINSGDSARYGAFPSEDVWYISGGHFPVSLTGFANDWESRFDLDGLALNERIRVSVRGGKEHFKFVKPIKAQNAEDYAGIISKTVDGGRTFQTVFSDVGNFYFNGISCTNVDQCIAVAEGPLGAYIFATSNGGASWEQTLFTENQGLFQVQFRHNSTEAWAVGGDFNARNFHAIFYHTLDAGATWDTSSNIIEGAYPNALDVLEDGTAYATAFLANGLSAVLAYF